MLFGEGQDDDIYGGTGFDRIYGGTGQDGLLGDDGKMLTSRNGSTEPLNRLTVAEVETFEDANGPFIGGVVDLLGDLKKRAMLAADTVGWNDIIYGGLGDDFIHGGAGDDALSGAEAMAAFYNESAQTDGDPLQYDEITTMFAAWDNQLPFAKIPDFLLNFDAYRVDEATGAVLVVNGLGVKSADGRDRIFGDDGNDWVVGGTDCDWLFGGFGDDLLNLDDYLETDGGTNLRPETDERFNDGDFAFGGAGRDVLIANTGNDRMFDWTGEFNSFYAPFPRSALRPSTVRSHPTSATSSERSPTAPGRIARWRYSNRSTRSVWSNPRTATCGMPSTVVHATRRTSTARVSTTRPARPNSSAAATPPRSSTSSRLCTPPTVRWWTSTPRPATPSRRFQSAPSCSGGSPCATCREVRRNHRTSNY